MYLYRGVCICISCFYNINIDIFHIMLLRVKINEILNSYFTQGTHYFSMKQVSPIHLTNTSPVFGFSVLGHHGSVMKD